MHVNRAIKSYLAESDDRHFKIKVITGQIGTRGFNPIKIFIIDRKIHSDLLEVSKLDI